MRAGRYLPLHPTHSSNPCWPPPSHHTTPHHTTPHHITHHHHPKPWSRHMSCPVLLHRCAPLVPTQTHTDMLSPLLLLTAPPSHTSSTPLTHARTHTHTHTHIHTHMHIAAAPLHTLSFRAAVCTTCALNRRRSPTSTGLQGMGLSRARTHSLGQ